jgi:PHD/YefM family antitoxin component YafN of YafNO toxin-antitoxin module
MLPFPSNKFSDKDVDIISVIIYNQYIMNTITVTARDIARNYKEVFARVKQTRQPAIVMNQKEPQVAIVSLEDLEKLRELRYKNSAKNLLAWAEEVRELLKDETLPPDLSTRHDYYLWEEDSPAA